MNYQDPKVIDQALASIRQGFTDPGDEFKTGPLRESLSQFEQMTKFEKKIDGFFTRKRIDISEKLCHNRKTVTTILRLFIDSEVNDEDSEVAYIKLNVFGRLLLNEKPDVTEDEYFAHFRNSSAFERNFVKMFSFAENVRELSVDFEDIGISSAQYLPGDKTRRLNSRLESVDGFTVIRTVRKTDVGFPLNCTIRVSLESCNTQLKLSSDLAAFMKRSHATRREVLDALYEYCKANALIENQNIKFNPNLRALFGSLPDGKEFFPVHELSSRVKMLVSQSEEFEFHYQIQQDAVLRKYLNVYDIKFPLVLEAVPDILAFYASKLILMEEDRKKTQLDDHGGQINPALRTNEKLLQIQDQIGRKIVALKAAILKRDMLKQLAEDPTDYLETSVKNWERHLDHQKKLNSNMLVKRPMIEENEFLGLLHEKYEGLLDKEIETYLKPKGL